MKKKELVDTVAEALDTTKIDAEKVIAAILDCIAKALGDEDYVKLIGFGTFKTTMRKAVTGRNPRTGETIQVPAKRMVKFVPGSELKEAVNTGVTSE